MMEDQAGSSAKQRFDMYSPAGADGVHELPIAGAIQCEEYDVGTPRQCRRSRLQCALTFAADGGADQMASGLPTGNGNQKQNGSAPLPGCAAA
jgi:hypothetical protein